jgi:hypothetical protein
VSELRQTGSARLSLPIGTAGAGSEDALLAAVRATAAPDFEVLGEIARSPRDGAVLFLARSRADRGLVALRLSRRSGGEEFSLELVRQLDPTLPSPGGTCARCGAQFLAWARFCSKCGSALFGDARPRESPHAREELLAAVEEAAAGRYDILGEMRHSDGPGVVYFARDLATGRIEALRVQPEGADEFSVGKTNVMRRLSVSIQAARDPAPAARPAPPAQPRVPPPAQPRVPPRPPVVPPTRPAPVTRRPLVEPRPPAQSPAATQRRSLHIPLPDVSLPELPPVVWVLIGAVVLALIIIVVLA